MTPHSSPTIVPPLPLRQSKTELFYTYGSSTSPWTFFHLPPTFHLITIWLQFSKVNSTVRAVQPKGRFLGPCYLTYHIYSFLVSKYLTYMTHHSPDLPPTSPLPLPICHLQHDTKYQDPSKLHFTFSPSHSVFPFPELSNP